MLIFVPHLALMIGICWVLLLCRAPWPRESKLLAGIVVTWVSLVISALGLSCVNRFGDNSLYLVLTVAIQIFLSWILAFRGEGVANDHADHASVRTRLREMFSTWPRVLILLGSLLLGGMVLTMSLRTNLQIPDTLAMKIPNAFFYLQNGNLWPAFEHADEGRLFGTPFNGTILWSYFIRFHQPTRIITAFNFFFWLSIILATYRLCRLLNASRWGAFSGAVLFGLSQCLLFQASSDNDDLLSSVTGTIGVVFLFYWLKHRRRQDLLLAGLGLGVCAGAKLFPALYAPAGVWCGAYYVWRYIKNRQLSAILPLVRSMAALGLLISALTVSYFYVRIAHSKSGALTSQMLSMSENKPFRSSVAAHNVLVYNLQLFASPLTDAFFPRSGSPRESFVEKINTFAIEKLIPEVGHVFAYMPGVKIVHPDLYDNTVWYGIIAWLIAAAFVLILFDRKRWFTAPFWLMVFFISWDFYFCFRTKYIEELGRYWILPISLTIPLVALLIDNLNQRASRSRLSRVVLPVVWCSTFFCGYIGLVDNPIRINFRRILRESVSPPIFSEDVHKALATCPKINVLHTVYGYPVYWHIADFRGEDFSYMSDLVKGRTNLIPTLDIPLFSPFYEQKYLVIDLKRDRGGIKSLGQTGLGFPMFVYDGGACACEAACPKTNSYLMVQASPLPPWPSLTVKTELKILTEYPNAKFKYRALADYGHERKTIGDWSEQVVRTVDVPGDALGLIVEASEEPVELLSKPQAETAIFTGRLSLMRR